jgi:hypothetical protein
MNSSLLVAIEFTLVIGIVLGLAVWELLRLRREVKRDAEQREPPGPPRR